MACKHNYGVFPCIAKDCMRAKDTDQDTVVHMPIAI